MPRCDRVLRLLLLGAAGLTLAACSEAAPPDGSDSVPARSAASGPVDPGPQRSRVAEPVQALHSDGDPQRALLSISRLGLHELVVVPYVGWTDDAPGTRIQNGGTAASPHGPRGGVGPGGIGNYQVTGHRTSSTRAFEFLPDLRRGDRVRVEAGGATFVYRIVGTRETSFREPESLREQRADAAGNYWADRFHNPEHRIDKIGVLVSSRRA